MKINPDDIKIIDFTIEISSDWSIVFLKGISSFRWMSRYIKSQDISELDVKISIEQDISNRTSNEQFLIAYYENIPVGIIRASEYWISNSFIIPSHFPLVIPRFQRKGIGRLLVEKIIDIAFNLGYIEIWTETWSKDKRDLSIYQSFYEKIGFNIKSERLEMSCSLDKCKTNYETSHALEIINESEITDQFVDAISTSYADSKDNLHRIEMLGDKEICRKFLFKIKKTFEQTGYVINCYTIKESGEICAGLMSATSHNKGMVLEIGVLTKYRRKGIAQFLINNYIKELKKEDIEEIILAVDSKNIPAINLYEKMGFKPTWYGIILLLDKNKI